MHELSLLSDLFRKIETVVSENQARRATRVSLQLGPFAHISPSHLREHFDEAKGGTAAENAELEVTMADASDPNAQDILLTSVEVE